MGAKVSPPEQALRRSVGGTLALRLASGALTIGTTLLLARLLGAGGYGAFAWALAWVSVVRLAAVAGLDRLVAREVSRYRAESAWALIRGLRSRANQIGLATSVTLCAIAELAGWTLLDEDSPLRRPFLLALLLVPLATLLAIGQGTLQAFGRVVAGQATETVAIPLLFLALVAASHQLGGTSPVEAMVLQLAAAAVGLAGVLVLVRRTVPEQVSRARPRYATGEWARSALRLALIGGTVTLQLQAGTIMLGAMESAEEAGRYAVAARGASIILAAGLAVNLALGPLVAFLHASADRARLQQVVTSGARMSLGVSVLAALPLLLFPHELLGLFGEAFTGGGDALRILAGAFVVNAVAGPSSLVLIMTRHERDSLLAVVAGTVVTVVLTAILVPPWGALGAALAAGAGIACWNLLLVWRVACVLELDATVFGMARPPA